mmetsp:Transcript_19392/g.42357  ORF Transcript_19392/g.42357 Transcript_19392/m.42357 type:complete len:207 (+) Transcript_19392:604-1224(+)
MLCVVKFFLLQQTGTAQVVVIAREAFEARALDRHQAAAIAANAFMHETARPGRPTSARLTADHVLISQSIHQGQQGRDKVVDNPTAHLQRSCTQGLGDLHGQEAGILVSRVCHQGVESLCKLTHLGAVFARLGHHLEGRSNLWNDARCHLANLLHLSDTALADHRQPLESNGCHSVGLQQSRLAHGRQGEGQPLGTTALSEAAMSL